MKKLLVTSLLGFALCVTSSHAQSNVYAANVVGYVTRTNAAGSVVMLANPLDNGTNDLVSLLPTAANGSVVWVFTGGLLQPSTKTKGTWSTDLIIPPGTGFFFSGSRDGTNTFVGQTGLTNAIVGPAGGTILIGSPIPFSGRLSDAGINTMNLNVLPNGSTVDILVGGVLQQATKNKGVWTHNFNIQPAQGFYLTANSPIDIVQVLSLGPVIPVVINIQASGANLVFSGTNGIAGAPYYVLSSTNLGLPATQWTILGTNYFDDSGNFNFTNIADLTAPQMFYTLQTQQ